MSSSKQRLDQLMVNLGLARTRSQAENLIRLGKVKVGREIITKPGYFIRPTDSVKLDNAESYVSRAALKLASVSDALALNFKNKVVLDVGSSTGGFTDYALQHGAAKVIAVDVGTNQLHPSLRNDPRIELHEKTDIRNFKAAQTPDLVLADVSFISLRQILPAVAVICGSNSQIAAMVKPQFEAAKNQVNKGVIKNSALRRRILKEFESWASQHFVVVNKADSQISGAHGNLERFYLLNKLP